MTLVAADFDGTLTESDLAVLLGREYDVAGEIRGLAERGLRGEVEFDRVLRQQVSLLEGMPEARVDAAFDRCKLRNGAADLIADLRRSGVRVAVATGTFERGVEAALDRAGVAADHLVANRLVTANGALTGEVEGPLIEGGRTACSRISPRARGRTWGGPSRSGTGPRTSRCSGWPGRRSASTRTPSSRTTATSS